MSYTLGKLLGRGGFGNVYLGQDNTTNKLVTVKVVPYNEQNIDRLRREFEIGRYLSNHKNIATVINAYIVDDKAYIISEYIANAITLDRWQLPDISTRSGLLILLDVMYELVETYIFIHSQHVAHRDVKLENIVMKGNIPIIIDWDFACFYEEGKISDLFPCKGYVGTGEYIAPEIWRKEDYDPFLTDIYSLGIVFYNLANRKRFPYNGETNEEIKKDVLRGLPEFSSSGNYQLDDMIMAMIDSQASQRMPLEESRKILQDLIKTI